MYKLQEKAKIIISLKFCLRYWPGRHLRGHRRVWKPYFPACGDVRPVWTVHILAQPEIWKILSRMFSLCQRQRRHGNTNTKYCKISSVLFYRLCWLLGDILVAAISPLLRSTSCHPQPGPLSPLCLPQDFNFPPWMSITLSTSLVS